MPSEKTFNTVIFNVRAINTATSNEIKGGSLVGKPSDNNALFTTIGRNGITKWLTFNNRRSSRTKRIKNIHNCQILPCASKDGTFVRENRAPKWPARFQDLGLAAAIPSVPEIITRPFLTAAQICISAKANQFTIEN